MPILLLVLSFSSKAKTCKRSDLMTIGDVTYIPDYQLRNFFIEQRIKSEFGGYGCCIRVLVDQKIEQIVLKITWVTNYSLILAQIFTCEITVAVAIFATVPKWRPGLKKTRVLRT